MCTYTNITLLLLKQLRSVFGRAAPGIALKYLGKIIGITVSDGFPDVFYIDRRLCQELLCFLHPELCQIRREITLKSLLKKFAEIRLRIVHHPCHILHGKVVHIMLADIAADHLRYLGQPSVTALSHILLIIRCFFL